ncbi:HNH endonuclease [Undibacterium sp. SXout11W]|uniref:HNH endonuclease n=1 Tax=Undibacterium sp. SXout11W TaxID=3413050 RepID=UPI003BF09F63
MDPDYASRHAGVELREKVGLAVNVVSIAAPVFKGISWLKGIFSGIDAAKAAVADGRFYSVAFETRLSAQSYPGVTRYMEANIAIEDALASNPALTELGISVPKSATGSILGKSPEGWVWHHDTAPGVMQLVPKSQHPNIPGGIFWETLHPDGLGGFSIWGK